MYYLLFLRLTPLLPNWFVNVACPVVGVPLWKFAAATFIGTVRIGDACLLWAYAAAGGQVHGVHAMESLICGLLWFVRRIDAGQLLSQPNRTHNRIHGGWVTPQQHQDIFRVILLAAHPTHPYTLQVQVEETGRGEVWR